MPDLAFDNRYAHMQEEAPKKVLLGRPGNNVKMGIVGLPNVGKCVYCWRQLWLHSPAKDGLYLLMS
jgi:hypothetical protein